MMSALERFLGCVYMRRHLQRIIQDCLTALPSNEPGVIQFRSESLQGRVVVNPIHMQGLQLKLSPGAEYREQWNMEDLQVLERFFELRVMAIPFKPNAIHAFGRLLNAPFRILRDLIQVMKLELIPSFAQQYQLKWSVQFCLTVPPSAPYIVPIGSSSILTATNKLLFFLYIRRLGMPAEAEGSSVVIPLVYDCNGNVTQLAERRDAASNNGPSSGSPLAQTAGLMLKRFTEYGQSFALSPGDCSIFPAIRDLLTNLTLPNEPQVMNVGMQQANMGQVNVPMGLGSGPQQVGMGNIGPGTPINPLQMQGGPMPMGVGHQSQQPQSQVTMPIQSPYAQGMNSMTPMGINNLGPNINMGQPGPGMGPGMQ